MSTPVDTTALGRLFRRGFAETLALDLVSSALGAITVVVLIRGLSVSSYAYTTLFLTFAQFAGSAATGGVRTRYVREEAERFSRGGPENPTGAFADTWLKGTLLIVAIGICALPLAAAIGFGSQVGGSASLIVFATCLSFGFCAVELAMVHYQARRRFFTAGALKVLRAGVLLGVAFAITLTSQNVLAMSLWFIGGIAGVGLITAGPIARRSFRAATQFRGLPRFKGEEMWLSFYSVAAAGFAYVDVMVAGALLTKHQVATLGAALRYLAIVLGAMPALGAVLRVRTSQADLVDSPERQQTMVLHWIRRATLPGGLLVGIAVLLAPLLIPAIDGGRYPGSIAALQIFLVAALSAYLTAPATNMLLAQRRYPALASIFGTGLVLNLIGDIAVAQRFGVIGIAIVSTSVYVAIDVAVVVRSLPYKSRIKP
jgi:O-antigen/teichoic acid export membrane protein